MKKALLGGPKSIADLCICLYVSTPTCLSLINSLVEEGIVIKEGQGQSIGGRKPDLYALLPGKFFVLCIEVERYQTRMAVMDNNYNYILPVRSYDLDVSQEVKPSMQLHNLALQCIRESGIDVALLAGIGINMPGLLDTVHGNNHTFILPTQQLSALQQELTLTFNTSVYLQNDVKCYAAAEKRFGLAKDKKDVLVLLMDWGIGLGIIMDGELRAGTAGFSGEIGHIPFIDDGALCYCGKRGCLETVASGTALARLAKEGIQSGQYSLLNSFSENEIDKIEPHAVIEAANRGDQFAIKILADVGTKMGKGIAILLQLFNPELIILEGKMAKAGQYLTIPMQQAINTYCMTQIRDKATIQVSELGINASIQGIATIVFNNYFDKLVKNEN